MTKRSKGSSVVHIFTDKKFDRPSQRSLDGNCLDSLCKRLLYVQLYEVKDVESPGLMGYSITRLLNVPSALS